MEDMEKNRQIANQLSKIDLFINFTEFELLSISHLFRVKELPPHTVFINEGDEPQELFLMTKGEAEVLKFDKDQWIEHRIAMIKSGEMIGELALIDNSPRSATVKTTQASIVLTISIQQFQMLLKDHLDLGNRVYFNLAKQISTRLKSTSKDVVEALKQKLQEASIRISMGRFVVYVIFMICTYTFMIQGIAFLVRSTENATLIGVPLLIVFGSITLFMMYHNQLPLSTYGLTLKNIKSNLFFSALYSIPIMFIVLFFKWLMIQNISAFSGEPLFNNPLFGLNSGDARIKIFLAIIIFYALAIPLQEILTRGAIQGSLSQFLTGPYKNLLALLVANILFCLIHLHLSLIFSVVLFPLGLFWGWLFLKQKSIIGVSFSHFLIGVWGYKLIGFDFLYQS